MFCKCEPKLRSGSWRERTKASNKSLPPADSAVLIRCGVRSCDPWEPRPASIAVSSTVLKGALNCRKTRLWNFNADGFDSHLQLNGHKQPRFPGSLSQNGM